MKKEIIRKTKEFVKTEMENADKGHDYWHILRVYNLSKEIAKEEDVDLFVVELAALLHDVSDSKFNNGDEEIGLKKVNDFLEKVNVDEDIRKKVIYIIENMSFQKSFEKKKINLSKELMIVQDADRIDAIGAIGIARAFTFGGHIHNEIYNPNIKYNKKLNKEDYKKRQGTTINHFYEKLLILKDKMLTKKGKEIAKNRTDFMQSFLKEFYLEWDGKK